MPDSDAKAFAADQLVTPSRIALRKVFLLLSLFALYAAILEISSFNSLLSALLEFVPYCFVLTAVIYIARPLLKGDRRAPLMFLCLGAVFVVFALDVTKNISWFDHVAILGKESKLKHKVSSLAILAAIASLPMASFSMIDEILRAKTLLAEQLKKLKTTEKALTLQKTILEAQNEAALDGLLTVDENHKVISQNRRLAEMWDMPKEIAETASGEACMNWILQKVMEPESEQERIISLNQNKDLQTLEDVYLKDGRTFKRYSAPVRSDAGEYFGRIWVYRDVSEQMKSEKELRRLYEQTLRDTETKTELLREINHRVKNNLVSILGLIQNQHRHGLSQEEKPVVKIALERLSQQVRGLIEVHQMLSGAEWRPMVLANLAHHVISAVTGMAEPSNQIRLEISSSSILVSPRQANAIGLVLNELAMNTLKHAAQGKPLTCIHVSIQQEGDWIDLEYRDDGPGFPEDVLAGRQHGVGLSLIQQLAVGAFRGRLELSNEDGAKALLTIRKDEIERT